MSAISNDYLVMEMGGQVKQKKDNKYIFDEHVKGNKLGQIQKILSKNSLN